MKTNMSKKNYISASFIFFLSGFFFFSDTSKTGSSCWMIIIISSIISFPFIILINRHFFRHGAGKFFKIILIFFSLISCSVSVFGLGRFVQSLALSSAPGWLLPFALLLTSIWAGLKTNDTLLRFCGVLLPFLALSVLFFLFCSIPLTDNYYVSSLVSADMKMFFLDIPVCSSLFILKGTVLSIVFYENDLSYNINGIIFSGMFSAVSVVSSIFLTTLLVLGNYSFEVIRFPVFFPLGIVEISSYLQRFEILLLFFIVIIEFVKYACFVLFIKKLLTDKLTSEKENARFPVS